MVTQDAELVLELKAAFSMLIGYAVVFGCDVLRVVQGHSTTTEFDLTVLPSDPDLATALHARQPPAVVEAGFRKHHTGERRQRIPITGFVDDDGTAWTLVYVR